MWLVWLRNCIFIFVNFNVLNSYIWQVTVVLSSKKDLVWSRKTFLLSSHKYWCLTVLSRWLGLDNLCTRIRDHNTVFSAPFVVTYFFSPPVRAETPSVYSLGLLSLYVLTFIFSRAHTSLLLSSLYVLGCLALCFMLLTFILGHLCLIP